MTHRDTDFKRRLARLVEDAIDVEIQCQKLRRRAQEIADDLKPAANSGPQWTGGGTTGEPAPPTGGGGGGGMFRIVRSEDDK